MELLVATIHKYDPDYKDKVHLVVETIDHELCERKQFSVADVNRYLDIDCHRYLRLLGRVGFLRRIPPKPGLEASALSLTPLGGAPERFFGKSVRYRNIRVKVLD